MNTSIKNINRQEFKIQNPQASASAWVTAANKEVNNEHKKKNISEIFPKNPQTRNTWFCLTGMFEGSKGFISLNASASEHQEHKCIIINTSASASIRHV